MRAKLFFIIFLLILGFNVNAQLGGLLNKVKNKVIDRALGKEEPQNEAGQPKAMQEPASACVDARIILKLTEGIKIDYKEAVFSVLDDGTLLVFSKPDQKYYTVKDGVLQGPYVANDPVVRQFDLPKENNQKNYKIEDLMARYKGIIVPSGEKYAIVFNGKTYGPYAIIQNFVRNTSNTKFAAIVTEDVLFTEKQGAKMEEAMKNAKNDQEKMQIAMQINQQMQENMMKQSTRKNGELDLTPKIVSNIPDAKYDLLLSATFSTKVKYDEIVYVGLDKIMDLAGNTLFTIDTQKMANNSSQYWLSSDNSMLASYNYGVLSFSNGKQLTEVFCPYIEKFEGKVYLTYMYFSPKNNAIMQCRITF